VGFLEDLLRSIAIYVVVILEKFILHPSAFSLQLTLSKNHLKAKSGTSDDSFFLSKPCGKPHH
jgi:hypothetical protein